MIKIITIVGARPQFIKSSPVSKSLAALGIIEKLLHTGQHYDESMSGIFFEELKISKPTWNLEVGSGSHARQTAKIIQGTEEVLKSEYPDYVIVYGDTNSTLGGSISASKLNIPIIHIEAGLRSFNRSMPEEINRIITDSISSMLFSPTLIARNNLIKEGHNEKDVFLVGDVMIDSLIYNNSIASDRILEILDLKKGQFILATIHRANNTDEPVRLDLILSSLEKISEQIQVVLPLHPRTRKIINNGSFLKFKKIKFIDPVGYLDMLSLERGSSVIVTDSGGIQKEAYFFKIPCVTLRDETEWVELVDHKWNELCPINSTHEIVTKIINSIGKTGTNSMLYGDGTAANKIAHLIFNHYSTGSKK